jgi:hypothetical protein
MLINYTLWFLAKEYSASILVHNEKPANIIEHSPVFLPNCASY